jgi:DNA helicase-2/ATP-dependent DNA helicase PcrA
MRLHYVAFSRPQKLLVLTAHETPKDHFAPIWQGLPQWPYVQKDLLAAQRFEGTRADAGEEDLQLHRRPQDLRDLPAPVPVLPRVRLHALALGGDLLRLLVHQTIEEIHRIALDGRLDTLDEPRIRELFERTFRFLCLSDVRPIGDAAKEAALTQVLNYFRQNRDEMRRVIQTEVDVSLEKDGYILTGKVDLLLGGDGKAGAFRLQDLAAPERQP